MRIGAPGIAVAASAVLVSGLVAWGSADQLGAGDPDNAATRLVPPDGTRTVWRDGDGRLTVTEDARLSGVPVLVVTPPEVAGGLAASLDGDPQDWRFWRSTTTTYDVGEDETGEQSTTLYRLTDDGVEQVATYGAFTLAFDPPLLALPDDVEDGTTWSVAGDASADGSLTYEYDAQASSGTEDCLGVIGTLTLRQGGEQLAALDVDEDWCPGAALRVDAATVAEPPAYAGSTTPQVGLASGAEDWVAHPRPLTVAASVEDAGAGDPAASASVDFAPAGTGAGGLTLPNTGTDDLFGFVPRDDRLVRAWLAHPGGDVTSVATSGEVSVVGTSRRELVGYGERGQWLWSTDLGGVAVATPLAADEDHLVAATVAGDVVVLDPATGEVAWRDTMTDAVRRTPVTDGETLVAVDVAGHVAAWDLDSGEELWADDIHLGGALGISGGVLAVRGENAVLGSDLRTGTRLWSTRVGIDAARAAVVGTGRTFAVAGREKTVGIDRVTGERLWERAGAELSVGLDARIVQLTDDDELVVRDGDGDQLARLDLEGLAPGSRWLSAADAGVWVADALGHVLEVSP